MCFAAADYFAAGKPIPRDNKPPASGSALHDYLFERQFDSFGDVGETVIRFLIWMANDDEEEDGVWYDTYEEMQTVVEQLDNGHPVVLGLVVAGGDDESDIWDNHQVLAYGYTKPSADELIVNIYDPNYPKRDEIRLHFNRVVVGDDEDEQIYGLQGNEVVAASTVRKFRGAFVIDYEGR